MSDRELLELAAKAAGIPFESMPPDWEHPGIKMPMQFGFRWWNPLQDDGDALRLAVKLRMRVEINDHSVLASYVDEETQSDKKTYYYPEDYDSGMTHEEATRRAIVRAAAEIGKQCTPC